MVLYRVVDKIMISGLTARDQYDKFVSTGLIFYNNGNVWYYSPEDNQIIETICMQSHIMLWASDKRIELVDEIPL